MHQLPALGGRRKELEERLAQGPHWYVSRPKWGWTISTKPMLTTAASDFGTITILWSQPVTALQILAHDGKWRWVKHIDNALVRLPLAILFAILYPDSPSPRS